MAYRDGEHSPGDLNDKEIAALISGGDPFLRGHYLLSDAWEVVSGLPGYEGD